MSTLANEEDSSNGRRRGETRRPLKECGEDGLPRGDAGWTCPNASTIGEECALVIGGAARAEAVDLDLR